jgi:hypothetical protein
MLSSLDCSSRGGDEGTKARARTEAAKAEAAKLRVESSAGPASGQTFKAVHGVDGAGYQEWFDRVMKDGYRPVYVNGYDTGTRAAYAAVAVRDAKAPGWMARHALTSEEYQKALDAAVAQGYRPSCVSGYLDAGVVRFTAIFVRDRRPVAWEA